jgi:hypothetical protein
MVCLCTSVYVYIVLTFTHAHTHTAAGESYHDLADYTSYNCSQRVCPVGHSILVALAAREKQSITCTGTTGTFTLAFRQVRNHFLH